RQVKTRIRKVGSPGSWIGELTAYDADDNVIDGFPIAIPEPAYTDGVATITWSDLDWGDEVRSVRIDLSSLQDADNYFEFDWIAIGRSSPGASSAALAQLAARVTQTENSIEAVSEDVTQLQSTIAGKADSSALSDLETRVTQTEGSIEAVSQDVVQLQSDIEDKASSTA